MRKFIIAMIAALSVITAGLILLLVFVLNSGSRLSSFTGEITSFGSPAADLVRTSNYSLEGITGLTLEYSSDDVFFYESDTQELILKEYMSIEPKEDELTQVKQSGSLLQLRSGERMRRNWLFNHYNGYVEVYLPSSYAGSLSVGTSSGSISSDPALRLEHCEATASSGDISFKEVVAPQITASTSSGSIRFDKAEGSRSFTSSSGDIMVLCGDGDSSFSSTSGSIIIKENTGRLSAGASSGDISITKVFGDKEIETTSGVITISDCTGFLRASSSSGNISCSNQTGAGSFETTSGSVIVDWAGGVSPLDMDISADTSSGDVSFRIPEAWSFDFEARTSSGRINTYFDDLLSFKNNEDHAKGSVGSNPSHRILISTTSGNITVKGNGK